MNVVVFDIETIPDINLGRKLFGVNEKDDIVALEQINKIHSENIKIIEPNSTIGNILKRYEIIIKAISISNAWHALYLTK